MRILDVLQALMSGRRDLPLSAFSPHQVDWVLASGLGPALFRAVEHHPDGPGAPRWPELQGAELAARVLAAHQTAAVLEVIDACQADSVPLTLLKGIALSELYPSPHLRPMRDIDVLVPAPLLPRALAACRTLGYRDDPDAVPGSYDEHHHAAPLVHEVTGIWLEIHHRLFPVSRAPGADPFSPDRVTVETVTSSYHGRQVGRLRPELELPYVACHWARSGKPIGEPGGGTGLLDIALLSARMSAAAWTRAVALVAGSSSAFHLGFVLDYLAARQLLAPTTVPDRGPIPGLARPSGAQRWLAHWVVDQYVVEGWRPGGRLGLRAVETFWSRLLPRTDSVRT